MIHPHHTPLRSVIALLLLYPLIASALGPMRTFTDANGRKTLASFVAARGDEVIIQTTDGRQHVLKTANLSPGMKCIQTVFRDYANEIGNGLPQIPGGGNGLRPGMVNPITPSASLQWVKVHEIVHWYLAEPFARCLLEIAEKSGVSAP